MSLMAATGVSGEVATAQTATQTTGTDSSAAEADAYIASPDYRALVEPFAGLPDWNGNPDRSRLHAREAFASFVAGFDRVDR